MVVLPEDKLKENSRDDTEELVKGVIREKLKVNVEVKIERAILSGSPHAPFGRWFKEENLPRPVIARLACWKQKEAILKAAREVKPMGICSFPGRFGKNIAEESWSNTEANRWEEERQYSLFNYGQIIGDWDYI